MLKINKLTQSEIPDPVNPKHCPFCGGEAIIYRGTYRDIDFYYLLCGNEDCELISPERETEKEAIEAWNSIEVRK